jgi:hypothetical protein
MTIEWHGWARTSRDQWAVFNSEKISCISIYSVCYLYPATLWLRKQIPLNGQVNLGPDFLAIRNRATAETLIEYESNTGAVSHVPILRRAPRTRLTYMASANRPETYGVTPPISKDGPSSRETTLAVDLMTELRAQGTFEPEEDSRKR